MYGISSYYTTKYNEKITIWDTVAGISGFGVWFCGDGGVEWWGGGAINVLNMINDNMALFEVSSPIG